MSTEITAFHFCAEPRAPKAICGKDIGHLHHEASVAPHDDPRMCAGCLGVRPKKPWASVWPIAVLREVVSAAVAS